MDFCPEDPSISRMNSLDKIELKLCPVRAWEIYRKRRSRVVNHFNNDCFWAASQDTLSEYFVSLVKKALVFSGHSVNVKICVHQMRKLAGSLSKKFFNIIDKDLCAKMGSKSMVVLNKAYIRDVSPLKFTCVVPAGTLKASSNLSV